MNVAVVGLGRAGLPLACCMAESGIQVFGIDSDQQKVDAINGGVNPYPDEPGLDEIISHYGSDDLYATTDFDVDVDVYVVVVPVGLTPDNHADLSILEDVVRKIGRVIEYDDLVIIETTVPVGTTEGLVRQCLEEESCLSLGDFYLAHSPERIMSGMAMSRLKSFPKIVGGANSASGLKAHAFYSGFLPDVRLASSSREAEFVKIAEGAYRDVNIALANELYMAASTYGIDYSDARSLANHEYCHLHQAGVGVGGHCICTYPHFLISDDCIARPELLALARSLNDGMVEYWTARIMHEIEYDPDAIVCIRGIGYRSGSNLLTNSRAVALYHSLFESGVNVYVYDDLLAGDANNAKLGLRWCFPEDADFVFNPFTLELDHA